MMSRITLSSTHHTVFYNFALPSRIALSPMPSSMINHIASRRLRFCIAPHRAIASRHLRFCIALSFTILHHAVFYDFASRCLLRFHIMPSTRIINFALLSRIAPSPKITVSFVLGR
jgi:hypothetical protein